MRANILDRRLEGKSKSTHVFLLASLIPKLPRQEVKWTAARAPGREETNLIPLIHTNKGTNATDRSATYRGPVDIRMYFLLVFLTSEFICMRELEPKNTKRLPEGSIIFVKHI